MSQECSRALTDPLSKGAPAVLAELEPPTLTEFEGIDELGWSLLNDSSILSDHDAADSAPALLAGGGFAAEVTQVGGCCCAGGQAVAAVDTESGDPEFLDVVRQIMLSQATSIPPPPDTVQSSASAANQVPLGATPPQLYDLQPGGTLPQLHAPAQHEPQHQSWEHHRQQQSAPSLQAQPPQHLLESWPSLQQSAVPLWEPFRGAAAAAAAAAAGVGGTVGTRTAATPAQDDVVLLDWWREVADLHGLDEGKDFWERQARDRNMLVSNPVSRHRDFGWAGPQTRVLPTDLLEQLWPTGGSGGVGANTASQQQLCGSSSSNGACQQSAAGVKFMGPAQPQIFDIEKIGMSSTGGSKGRFAKLLQRAGGGGDGLGRQQQHPDCSSRGGLGALATVQSSPPPPKLFIIDKYRFTVERQGMAVYKLMLAEYVSHVDQTTFKDAMGVKVSTKGGQQGGYSGWMTDIVEVDGSRGASYVELRWRAWWPALYIVNAPKSTKSAPAEAAVAGLASPLRPRHHTAAARGRAAPRGSARPVAAASSPFGQVAGNSSAPPASVGVPCIQRQRAPASTTTSGPLLQQLQSAGTLAALAAATAALNGSHIPPLPLPAGLQAGMGAQEGAGIQAQLAQLGLLAAAAFQQLAGLGSGGQQAHGSALQPLQSLSQQLLQGSCVLGGPLPLPLEPPEHQLSQLQQQQLSFHHQQQAPYHQQQQLPLWQQQVPHSQRQQEQQLGVLGQLPQQLMMAAWDSQQLLPPVTSSQQGPPSTPSMAAPTDMVTLTYDGFGRQQVQQQQQQVLLQEPWFQQQHVQQAPPLLQEQQTVECGNQHSYSPLQSAEPPNSNQQQQQPILGDDAGWPSKVAVLVCQQQQEQVTDCDHFAMLCITTPSEPQPEWGQQLQPAQHPATGTRALDSISGANLSVGELEPSPASSSSAAVVSASAIPVPCRAGVSTHTLLGVAYEPTQHAAEPSRAHTAVAGSRVRRAKLLETAETQQAVSEAEGRVQVVREFLTLYLKSWLHGMGMDADMLKSYIMNLGDVGEMLAVRDHNKEGYGLLNLLLYAAVDLGAGSGDNGGQANTIISTSESSRSRSNGSDGSGSSGEGRYLETLVVQAFEVILQRLDEAATAAGLTIEVVRNYRRMLLTQADRDAHDTPSHTCARFNLLVVQDWLLQRCDASMLLAATKDGWLPLATACRAGHLGTAAAYLRRARELGLFEAGKLPVSIRMKPKELILADLTHFNKYYRTSGARKVLEEAIRQVWPDKGSAPSVFEGVTGAEALKHDVEELLRELQNLDFTQSCSNK